MRKLLLALMMTFSINVYADNYGLSNVENAQEQSREANMCESHNGYAC